MDKKRGNIKVNKKMQTISVSKEEQYLRSFFTYLKFGTEQDKSKEDLEIYLTDKFYKEIIEKLKDDWITVYFNIYNYFICEEDSIYKYFYNVLINLSKEENDIKQQLKNIVISLMKICLRIYPPSKEDIFNFYQLFRLKDLNKKIFSLLMEIFNIIYSFDSSSKEYFSHFAQKEFFLFDGNSNVKIKLEKDWLESGFKENPNNDISEQYYVFGFCFRYFKKNEITILTEIKFKSNKIFILSIKDGILQSNFPFKDNVQIPILENKDYKFNIAFLQDRIQINIEEEMYEISEGLPEKAKYIIIGENFFGVLYNFFSTFTLEPLSYHDGSIFFMHPSKGGKFHNFFVQSNSSYESIYYPKKIYYLKKETKVNVNFSERILLFKLYFSIN